MILGQRLVLRGTLFGSLMVSICGSFLAASATLPPAIAATNVMDTSPFPNEEQSTGIEEGDLNDQPSKDDNFQECQVSVKYPQKVLRWCDLITRFSQKNNLPADLVAAVILQESGGNTDAYSSSGAVGLMQVMPRDGLAAEFMCVNGPCFSNRPYIKDLKDPEFNVKYGTKLLANLVKIHSSYRDALRAYGPMSAGYTYADKVLAIYNHYGE